MRHHRAARLRVARRLRRRAPRRLRRSSSAPGRSVRRQHATRADDDADAGPAAGAVPDAADDDGDGASVADDADADGAEDGERCAVRDDGSGRVASRPGYPAEPAARSRPFGRVSLAPPFASLTARSACPAARCAHRRCRTDTLGASFDRIVRRTAASSSRRRFAPRSSRCSPRSPFAGCAGCGHHHGSPPQHSVRRRCRLRRPPARAPHDAPPGAPVSPLVRALLRSAPRTSLRTAPCSRVRTGADSAAGAAVAVPRTTPCSIRRTSRRSSAAAAPMSRRRRRRFPELRCCSIGCPDRRGGLGSHTPRIGDAGFALRSLALRFSALSSPPGVPLLLDRAYAPCNATIVTVPRGPDRACRRALHARSTTRFSRSTIAASRSSPLSRHIGANSGREFPTGRPASLLAVR